MLLVLALGLGLVVSIILALTGGGGGILAMPLLEFGIRMGVAQSGSIGLLALGMGNQPRTARCCCQRSWPMRLTSA